ncbi:unnamed protein product [Caenorhabditis auriculariae]|uniref:Uncharacterized protein n=1 Tax=Caenorhabditis auriculariae TaxID=2777116 RepID=A0A8S1HKX4_9PELO|nr:unnamed protein product [Caenorhabditis auriculariae]
MLRDDRFTDTISRNTSVQSAISRFDQQRPIQLSMRPRLERHNTSMADFPSSQVGYSIREYNGSADPPQAVVVPIPRPRALPSSPDLRRSKSVDERSFGPTVMITVKPNEDDVTFMKANYENDSELELRSFDQGFRPTNFGRGIQGMYNTTMSEIDASTVDEETLLNALGVSPLPKTSENNTFPAKSNVISQQKDAMDTCKRCVGGCQRLALFVDLSSGTRQCPAPLYCSHPFFGFVPVLPQKSIHLSSPRCIAFCIKYSFEAQNFN